MVHRIVLTVLAIIVGGLGLWMNPAAASAAPGDISDTTSYQRIDLPGGTVIQTATFQNPKGISVSAALPYVGFAESMGAIGQQGLVVILGFNRDMRPGERHYAVITPDAHLYTGFLPASNP